MAVFWKHPHVRGEDKTKDKTEAMARETPPRAWGRLCAFQSRTRRAGNTPTCVGKTRSRRLHAGQAQKHPHVRGEDALPNVNMVESVETPPRAWGRLSCLVSMKLWRRNTPTCVGKTNVDAKMKKERRKHPHVRGEDVSVAMAASAALETPPRAWGRPIVPAL